MRGTSHLTAVPVQERWDVPFQSPLPKLGREGIRAACDCPERGAGRGGKSDTDTRSAYQCARIQDHTASATTAARATATAMNAARRGDRLEPPSRLIRTPKAEAMRIGSI